VDTLIIQERRDCPRVVADVIGLYLRAELHPHQSIQQATLIRHARLPIRGFRVNCLVG
jgi:hypothetical protein